MESNCQVSLGERLRAQREGHGYSQEQLAQALFVTRQTISGWERGRCQPDIGCLQQLAKIYKLSLDELLDAVATTHSQETLRRAALALLLMGVAATGVTAWGSFTGRSGFMPLVLAGAYCLLVNGLVWFAFSGAIKTGDVSLLAGFNASQPYHPPTLKCLLDAQRFWIILSTVIACLPLTMAVFWPFSPSYLTIVLFTLGHLSSVVVGLGFIQRRYASTLYTDNDKAWTSRLSSQPLTLFLGSMFLTLIASAVGVEWRGLQNNTPAALLFAFILTLTFTLQIIAFYFDMRRAKGFAEAGKPYRWHRGTLAVALLCLLLDGIIILVCGLSL